MERAREGGSAETAASPLPMGSAAPLYCHPDGAPPVPAAEGASSSALGMQGGV